MLELLIKDGKIIYDKIAVIGSPGSGKTFLSNAISDYFDGPIIHIDEVYWKTNTVHLSEKELSNRLTTVVLENKWMIDGTRITMLEDRIRRANLIVYLDLSCEECIEGIEERRKTTSSVHMCEDYDGFREYVKLYSETHKPVIEKMLSKYNNYRLIRLCSRRDSDEFILGVKSGYYCVKDL